MNDTSTPPNEAAPAAEKPDQPPVAKNTSGNTGLPENIVFYCKDCHAISGAKRVGRRYVYSCTACGTKNVAFGTHRSISRYFRVKEGSDETESSEQNDSPAGKSKAKPKR